MSRHDQQDGQQLTDLLDDQVEATRGQEKVTLGELLDNAGHASYGPLLLIPSLLALSPVGAVPGVAPVAGTIILLVAAQILVGLPHPWLPGWLLGFSFGRGRLESFVKGSRSWTRWIDGLLTSRLTFLTKPPFVQGLALLFIALAATFYPLELVPFGVAAPAAAASLLALGLTARDGVVVLLGVALAACAGWLLVAFWPF